MRSIRAKMLDQDVLSLAYREKWFKIWVPKDYKGLGLALSEGCRLLEELAYWDGGLGWTVTLCSGANMFCGFIDPEVAEPIFRADDVCFGGSGMVAGKTRRVEEGYILDGIWRFATGAPHLTHFTCNTEVKGREAEGYRSFFVDKDRVLIHYDWDSFGLEATASHSFSMSGVAVPATAMFDIQPNHARLSDPLYRYPFIPFAQLTLFANYLGMFRRFCDLVQKLFFEKSRNSEWQENFGRRYFKVLDEASECASELRESYYVLLENSWRHHLQEDKEALAVELERIDQSTKMGLKRMQEHILTLYPKCGTRAAQINKEINIVFRNFFTATQHSLLNS